MTTEDDFHRQLDADPDDWQCRLVFADWLQERDDPRADVWRLLGECRVRPTTWYYEGNVLTEHPDIWTYWMSHDGDDWSWVPYEWWNAWTGLIRTGIPYHTKTRREAEESMVRAFLSLPAPEQELVRLHQREMMFERQTKTR